MQPFLEGGCCEVRRRGIALICQGPCSLDICSVAHGTSLQKEVFSIGIIRNG